MLVARLGWTWEQAGGTRLTRLWSLFEHWRKEPPMGVLLAAFVGFEPEKNDLDKFAATDQFAHAFGAVVPETALPPQVQQSLQEAKADPRYHELMAMMKAGRFDA